jgi:superfamily II DNA or RNA helicase
MDYAEFIAAKSRSAAAVGFEADPFVAPLFGFQGDIVRWALRLGRAAIFADCGLGKTIQQLEWARQVVAHAGGHVLILAPLAVAQQTVREGARFGIAVNYVRSGAEVVGESGIWITNYEMLDRFDPALLVGIVLDESSILKAFDGKTRNSIITGFRATPYRLACTATPAPNDYMELGNHAEFLGVMTRAEMLSMYFVHDGGSTQDWRIKGHAEDAFWRWVCSWAVMVRKPSDIGHDDGDFILPPLEIVEHVVAVDHKDAHKGGMLFAMEAQTLVEQRAARRGSLEARVAKCAELANASDGSWIVWGELNDECDALESAIGGAVQVAGKDKPEDKIQRALDFVEGRARVMVSKPSVFGFGMNFQHCANVAFVGVSHSFEQFYQAVRRVYRFGQTKPVTAHIIIGETEGRVAANLRRKETEAAKMADAMVTHMRDVQWSQVRGTGRQFTDYNAHRRMVIPAWLTAYASEAA